MRTDRAFIFGESVTVNSDVEGAHIAPHRHSRRSQSHDRSRSRLSGGYHSFDLSVAELTRKTSAKARGKETRQTEVSWLLGRAFRRHGQDKREATRSRSQVRNTPEL